MSEFRVAWRVAALSPKNGQSQPTPCQHAQAGKHPKTLVGQVEARDDGGEWRLMHRFPAGIRVCCLADEHLTGPLARLTFWSAVWASWSRAPLDVALASDQLEVEVAARVSLPTPDERAMWPAYRRRMTAVALCSSDALRSLSTWSTWQKVTERFALYRAEHRPGETFTAWDGRSHETPPGWVPPQVDTSGRRRRRPRPEPSAPPPRSSARPSGQWWSPRPAPARPSPPSAFATLGLSWPCSEADIRSAWKRRALRLHPDVGGSHEAFLANTAARDEALEFLAQVN